MENAARYFADLNPNYKEDQEIASRVNDYFKYRGEFFIDGTEPPAAYISFVSWMCLHERNAHMGFDDDVSDINDDDSFGDYDCHGSGMKIMAFDEIEPVQQLNGLLTARNYKFDDQTGMYHSFDPGYPDSHPTIEEQVASFAEKNPEMMNELKTQLADERKKNIGNNLSMN